MFTIIEFVQDSPRTGLGIPVKTKKTPFSNQYTTHGTALQLWTSQVVGSSLKSRTTLPSTIHPGFPSTTIRLLGKPTSSTNQGRNKKIAYGLLHASDILQVG